MDVDLAETEGEISEMNHNDPCSQSPSLPSSAQQELFKNIELRQDQNEMLEYLSNIPDLRVKNQHKSESDFSKEQKLDVLKEKFVGRPLQFLLQFGKHLQLTHLTCFDQFKKDDESIYLYLSQLEKSMSAETKRIQAKNRRYCALQKLVETSDYFTEEAMQRRNPILYEQLVGKFQTKEEKQEFLKRSCQMASTSTTPLTDLLMAHMNRNEEGESYRRLDQEQQKAEEEEADAEYFGPGSDDESMSTNDNDFPFSRRRPEHVQQENENMEEIEDEEKEVFKEEFFTTMYQDFLEGKDADFDYSSVDNNDEYDIGENLEQDSEEKYFDDEEPCDANMDLQQESSDVDDQLFLPPVRCSEIESKIKVLKVTATNDKEENQNNHNEEDDEDELDKYMKSVERELQNQ